MEDPSEGDRHDREPRDLIVSVLADMYFYMLPGQSAYVIGKFTGGRIDEGFNCWKDLMITRE